MYTCTGPRGTPGDGLDGFSTPKNPHFDPSHPSVAPTSQKLDSRGCGSGLSTWYMWYTCTGTRGTPGDGLDGFSTPKNPHFDPSHPSVAPTSQKLHSRGCGSGLSTWYTWYTCTGTCGTPGDRLDGFSTLKNPHFDPSYIAVASKLWKLAFSVIGVRG